MLGMYGFLQIDRLVFALALPCLWLIKHSNISGRRGIGLELGHGHFSGRGVLVAHLHLREKVSGMKDCQA